MKFQRIGMHKLVLASACEQQLGLDSGHYNGVNRRAIFNSGTPSRIAMHNLESSGYSQTKFLIFARLRESYLADQILSSYSMTYGITVVI